MKDVILQSVVGSIFVAGIIGIVILILQPVLNKITKYMNFLSAFTWWLLLGIVFLGFMPGLLKSNFVIGNLGVWMLMGIIIFYALEVFFHWHHCKDIHEDWSLCSHHIKEHASWALISLGTFFHNMIHWVVILGAFASSLQIWITTTLAVALHAIPQNLANFLMNHKNFKYVWIAIGATVLGALVMIPFAQNILVYKSAVLAMVGWGLLYIALGDILPELSHRATPFQKVIYLLLALGGVGVFAILETILM